MEFWEFKKRFKLNWQIFMYVRFRFFFLAQSSHCHAMQCIAMHCFAQKCLYYISKKRWKWGERWLEEDEMFQLHSSTWLIIHHHSAAWVGGGLLCVIRFYHTRGSGGLRRLVGKVWYVAALYCWMVDLKWSIQRGVRTSRYEWHRPSRWVTKWISGDLKSR